MRKARVLALLSILALLPGCYAARIETGLPPSSTTITNQWASCWIYGLVPPTTVKAAAQCTNGVAIVETQLSFLNQVVGMLTFGIYTPMQIVVTCAERSSASMPEDSFDFTVSRNASTQHLQEVFAKAADRAVRTGQPVRVATTD